MTVVITSTTSSQKDMDHAVSDDWRTPPKEEEVTEAPVPVPIPEKESEIPPEVETPETEVEPKVEPEPTESDSEKEKPKPKEHKSGWQRRVDKLVARNHMLENELAEYKAKVKPEEAAAKAPELPKEPKLADFDGDVEKFVAHRDAWKDATARQTELLEQIKATNEAYNKRASEALGRYDDWSETVSQTDIVLPQAALDAIKEDENGPDIAYYLAKNPEEAATLMDMTPIRSIQAIAKLSDKIAADLAPPPPKPKVKAPEPIKPVGNSATRSSTLDEISFKEFKRIRDKQEREARRG